MAAYEVFHHSCSRSFREAAAARYPGLGNRPPYWRLLEHMIYSPLTWPDPFTEARPDPYLLMPHALVAQCVGVSPTNHEFRSGLWLARFSRDILPLGISDWRYTDAKARQVYPEIDPEILRLRAEDRRRVRDGEPEVWFSTGAPVTRRTLREAVHGYEGGLEMELENRLHLVEVHPEKELHQILNGQSNRVYSQILDRKLDAAHEVCLTYPEGKTKDHAERVLNRLKDCRRMVYAPTENSPRFYALGTTVNQLPRELRQVIFSGCVQIDLAACQLAVASVLWGLDGIREHLAAGKSYWKEVLTHLGLGLEFKGTLKRATYSILYGMGRKKLRALLIGGGDEGEPGLGKELAARFLAHPFVVEMLEAREWAYVNAEWERYLIDAYGREVWIRRSMRAHAAWSNVIQSYEMQVMAQARHVAAKHPDTIIVDWLHDGMYAWFIDKAKKTQRLRQLVQVIQAKADELGIPTTVEITE